MDRMLFNEEDFCKKYRGSEKFITEERKYFELFLTLLEDDDLLDKIKFANDVLGIPPLKTFIVYERDYLRKDVFTEDLTKRKSVKQGLGACFGYLYRFLYHEGYKAEPCWVMDKLSGIKTASRFVKKITKEE